MKVTVEVHDLRELLRAAHINSGDVARRLGISDTGMSFRMRGSRPFFTDEISSIAAAIEASGRTKVSPNQVAKLIGKKNISERRINR